MRLHRIWVALLAFVVLVPGGPAAGQDLPVDIARGLVEQGWWDESGTLDAAAMNALVAEHGGSIGFAYTDRAFDVNDPNIQAAALLAQAALDELGIAQSSVETVLVVTADQRSGASEVFSFSQVVLALDAFDGDDVVAGFTAVAERLTDPDAEALSQPSTPIGEGLSAEQNQGAFTMERLLLLAAIALGIVVLWTTYSRRRTTRRTVTTTPARNDTAAQITAMSDLILDLEPRVTIANDPGLNERFAAASRTYSDVREHAESATTGHEVADLRLEIAEARWKLDVIDAELDGRPAPPQPNTRDNSGSAWDSTRGTGGS